MPSTKRLTTRNIILTGMFTAIIAVMAQIIIPIQPIPFSFSLFAIFLTGILIEPKYAFLSVLAYILLGAFGLPVFAGFKGGFHIISGMTGGFIMAYPLMALITSLFYRLSLRLRLSSIPKRLARQAIVILGMIISLFICYLIGSLWFSHVSGSTMSYTLAVCVLPFVAFDLLKIVLALSFGSVLRRPIDKMTLS